MKRLGMKKLGISTVVLFGFLSLGGAPVDKSATKPVHEGDKQWVLSAPQLTNEKIASLKNEALDGSWQAAAELQNFYDYWFQVKESVFWGMVAIENGKQGASRYNLARTLSASPDPLQQKRARFWLKQIIEEKSEHSELAKGLLKELEAGRQDKTPFPERYPSW
jgi:hypothetical protein